MKVAIIIPARYESKRLPGKPLIDLNGKSMIQRVYENALNAAKEIENCKVIIATDDNRIEEHIKSFNGNCIMTSRDHKTGSDRILEAANKLDERPDIILNLQGDSPFTKKEIIIPLIEELKSDTVAQITTPGITLSWEQLDEFRKHKELTPSTGTTIIVDKDSYAIWFSKNIIPAIRKEKELREESEFSPIIKHPGLYCYRYEALKTFTELEQGYYEKLEELEQLRLLENNIKIKIVKMTSDEYSLPLAGVDTSEDVKKAQEILENEN